MRAVSIHSHSTYSFGDGFGLPADHVNRVAELGMSALGLTEHGNVSSHVKLEIAANKTGIKPLFGVEAYSAPDNMRERKNTRKWHQTILAMNQDGYLNLNKMVTRSWDEGFYRWPTVTASIFRDHHEGLVVTSGCSDGPVACLLLGGKGIEPEDSGPERAERLIQRYKSLLGDRYYLEVQQFPELERTRNLNPWLEYVSNKYRIPLVATFDAHYPYPEDNEMQKILHACNRGGSTVSAVEQAWQYDILLTYPLSDKHLLERLIGTGLSKKAAIASIRSTEEISERCNVVLPKMDRLRYPTHKEIGSPTAYELIRKWLNDGWIFRGFNSLRTKERRRYIERVHYELKILKEKDFIDYFLMIADLVRRAKDSGLLVGPARGSAAGSLICYLLRITEIDPMQYPMIFERFIDPTRSDMPDIDLDFDDEKRDYIRQLAIDKYGADCVGNIGTVTKYRGRNSIDDVARVHQLSRLEAAEIKECLVEQPRSKDGSVIEETRSLHEKIQRIFDLEPKFSYAERLEGNVRGFGVHAAGLVIGSEPITDVVASYTKHNVGVQKKDLKVMAVDKYDGAYVGLLKVDALGLTTMGMIKHALSLSGLKLQDLYSIKFDDEKVLAGFKRVDLVGVFQFEGDTMRMICEQINVKNFMDLVAVNALSRPGPLHSGSTTLFLKVRKGQAERLEIHPIVDKITEYTEGQIIYQEQMIQICRDFGLFNISEANRVRAIISHSEGGIEFSKLWDKFLIGALSNGASKQEAQQVWEKLISAGSYAFNIAHAISYSVIGYWCMWLKTYYPLEFYTASLKKTDPNNTERVLALMHDMQNPRFNRAYIISPPDLNKSDISWKPLENGCGVLAGFTQIKGAGIKLAETILAEREERGSFLGWDDLLSIKGVGIKKIQNMKDFCSSDDPFGSNWLGNSRNSIIEAIKEGSLTSDNGGMLPSPNLFAQDIPYDPTRSKFIILGVIKNRRLYDLYESHRAKTGKELNPSSVKDPHLKDSMTIYCQDQTGNMSLRVSRWAYPYLKGIIWGAKLDHDFILAEVSKSNNLPGKTIHVEKMWVVDPD